MAIAGYIKPYRATPAGQGPVILTLGTSIDHGAEPAGESFEYHGGWRQWVYAALVAAGRTPTMIGQALNATDGLALGVAGLAHGGINGATFVNWVASYWASNKATWDAQATPPTIILVGGAANDANTVGGGEQVGALVDLAAAAYPFANIVASNCTPNLAGDRSVINAEIASQVATKRAQGMHVQLLDSYSAIPASLAYLPDTLHPNAAGYALLGSAWTAAVMPLVA